MHHGRRIRANDTSRFDGLPAQKRPVGGGKFATLLLDTLEQVGVHTGSHGGAVIGGRERTAEKRMGCLHHPGVAGMHRRLHLVPRRRALRGEIGRHPTLAEPAAPLGEMAAMNGQQMALMQLSLTGGGRAFR